MELTYCLLPRITQAKSRTVVPVAVSHLCTGGPIISHFNGPVSTFLSPEEGTDIDSEATRLVLPSPLPRLVGGVEGVGAPRAAA